MSSAQASEASMAGCTSTLAPIALFVFNRPEYTEKTVDGLRANELAAESDLFVFSDGPRDEAGKIPVAKVRSYIRKIDGFKSVTIVERERNLGLANSVIAGVTELCNEFGRVIAMEDDLLTTPDFLTFMNQALVRYGNDPRIFSISGFNFGFEAPEDYAYDAFCFYRSSSWGWGTWKDRWEQADWKISDYDQFCADKGQQRLFSRAGEDLRRMLALQMTGRIDSWAIRWAYAHCKQDALALLSFRPRVLHIGSDGAATHSRGNCFKQLPLTSERKSHFVYPDSAKVEEQFVFALQKSLRPSLLRKLARYAFDGLLRPAPTRRDSAGVVGKKSKRAVAPEANGRSVGD